MSAQTLEIQHARLGNLSIPGAELIHFDGLPGFPDARRFALVEHDKDGAFAWLACCDDLELALPVVSMRAIRPDLCAALSDEALATVGAGTADEVEVLAIVNLRLTPPRVNESAPVLIHIESRRGSQVLVGDPVQIESKPQT